MQTPKEVYEALTGAGWRVNYLRLPQVSCPAACSSAYRHAKSFYYVGGSNPYKMTTAFGLVTSLACIELGSHGSAGHNAHR